MQFGGRDMLQMYCDDCTWEISAKRNWHNRDMTKGEWKMARSREIYV